MTSWVLWMSGFYYEVSASFRDAEFARAWVDWLRREHIADVIAAGALSGRIIALDSESAGAGTPAPADGAAELRFCVQYEFTNRAAFDAYVREHAPRLRAEGLKRFPPDVVTYTRRSGQVLR